MSDPIEIKIPEFIRNGLILWIVVAVMLLAAAVTSIYTVQAESQGVVLRFGQYLKTVEPGLRFKLPFGIDAVYVLPVRRQLKQEYGFGSMGATNPSQFTSRGARDREKSMMTGDLNAAEVEWIVQYRISDPRLYLLTFSIRREPSVRFRSGDADRGGRPNGGRGHHHWSSGN